MGMSLALHGLFWGVFVARMLFGCFSGGPFALIRHPIYTSVNLVALSTFLWAPSWPVLAACILVVIGSDLRARAEERLLLEAFGDQYRVFMRGRRRFLPFIY